GTTTVVVDPHEFANVLGVEGIRYVIDSAGGLPLNVYVMLSSCVPASPLESPLRPLPAAELLPLLDDPRVLGLAEVMDVSGVLHGPLRCWPRSRPRAGVSCEWTAMRRACVDGR